jgi:hypothetical protein
MDLVKLQQLFSIVPYGRIWWAIIDRKFFGAEKQLCLSIVSTRSAPIPGCRIAVLSSLRGLFFHTRGFQLSTFLSTLLISGRNRFPANKLLGLKNSPLPMQDLAATSVIASNG